MNDKMYEILSEIHDYIKDLDENLDTMSKNEYKKTSDKLLNSIKYINENLDQGSVIDFIYMNQDLYEYFDVMLSLLQDPSTQKVTIH